MPSNGVQKDLSQTSAKESLSIPDRRKERYFNNLSRIETLKIENFYPPEMKKHQWEEVQESPELEAFMNNFSIYDTQLDTQNGRRFDKRLLNVFRDVDTGRMFAAPSFSSRPNTRQIILDMLATTAELAPWSNFVGFKWVDGDQFFQQSRQAIYFFQSNWIAAYPPVIESLVNGLGDEKYSDAERRGFIIENISECIHETVHQYNDQDRDMGGPHRVLIEAASTTTEYMAFPGRNPRMTTMVDNALKLLVGSNEKQDSYEEALLIGMLISANENGYLSESDDKQVLIEGLRRWRMHIEGLPRVELEEARRKLEEKYLLSKQDEKLIPAIIELKRKFPESLKHLQLISWEHLAAVE